MIDEDLRQCIDESESDDRTIKNDQRWMKLLVTEHTNYKTQDDERVQTGSKRASRVVTPTVTGKSSCEESEGWKRRSVYQSDVISAMDGDGQNSPEISLTISRRTEESGVCNTGKMYIYQLMLPRRSLRDKDTWRAISREIDMTDKALK